MLSSGGLIPRPSPPTPGIDPESIIFMPSEIRVQPGQMVQLQCQIRPAGTGPLLEYEDSGQEVVSRPPNLIVERPTRDRIILRFPQGLQADTKPLRIRQVFRAYFPLKKYAWFFRSQSREGVRNVHFESVSKLDIPIVLKYTHWEYFGC
ncbi:unnamed protein product [Protopolystoma xenopodis]|uniref:Uncharacterized protein n=1 Tax=Protopolystoma xenopodis TaxID=117903 RepID=A0A448X7M0_9PLAT|nr:unnamed protein product [Protopolystoma xenopodis]